MNPIYSRFSLPNQYALNATKKMLAKHPRTDALLNAMAPAFDLFKQTSDIWEEIQARLKNNETIEYGYLSIVG